MLTCHTTFGVTVPLDSGRGPSFLLLENQPNDGGGMLGSHDESAAHPASACTTMTTPARRHQVARESRRTMAAGRAAAEDGITSLALRPRVSSPRVPTWARLSALPHRARLHRAGPR